jgi:hypothetical protein
VGMSMTRQVVTTLIAASVLSALASSAASAATVGWMVNGTLLSGAAALASTATTDEPYRLAWDAGNEIACNGSTLNSVAAEIKSLQTGGMSSLEFNECKAISDVCRLAGQPTTIGTVPLLLEATQEGALAAIIGFKPKTTTNFLTVKYEGPECAMEGILDFTGRIAMLGPTGQDESTLQLLESITTEASGELKMGSFGVSLKGSALLKLASGEPWSFL